MTLNKKGITLIEIIISIVLISIVLIFLFTMLIAVNDMNSESEMNSTYLINKSLFVKNVEDDLKYVKPNTAINIYGCDIGENEFFPAYNDYVNGLASKNKASECVKIKYTDVNGIEKKAYIGIFYLKTQEKYVLSYVNGSSKATRILPEFTKNNLNNSNKFKQPLYAQYYNSQDFGIDRLSKNELNPVYSFGSNTEDKVVLIKIPLIGPDGKDYTILISYIGKVIIYIDS